MKHRYIKLMLPVLLCIATLSASAWDIAVDNADGVTIYYNYSADGTELTVTNGDSKYNGNIIIPEEVTYMNRTRKVTSIGDRAFNNCGGLTSVTIPNSVSSIGNYAFRYCSSLTSVTIGNNVKSIGSGAFSGTGWYNNQVDGLLYLDNWLLGYKGDKPTGDMVVKSGTRGIAGSAFYGCGGLTSVTIPNSVSSIGNYAFRDCSGLTSVTIGNSVTSIGVSAFQYCSGLTSITIPNSVTSIGDCAFEGCSGLTSIKVDSGNTTYDSRENCNAIIETSTNILLAGCNNTVIPNSVTSIGNGAFLMCRSLISVTIPESVTSIGNTAFYGCSGLTSVTIPESVTSIGVYVFRDCSGLTSVTIPESVTSIGWGAFYGCSGLTSVTIGNSVTSIGDYTFSGCSGLTSVTIGNSVTSIGNYAFSKCRGLTSVTIPNSVTSIGDEAFSGTDSLRIVKSYIAEPFSISKFSEDTYRKGTLYVPKGTKDLYIRFDGWREFLNIIEMGDEPAPNGQCATPSIIVSGNKMIFECETPGAEFTSYMTSSEEFSGSEVVIENKDRSYTLTVYATAPGYERSEPATMKFVIKQGDVNVDGKVDVSDYIGIANLILYGTIDGK